MGASKLSDLTSAGVRVTALGCCLLLVSVLPTIHSSAHQLHSHPAPNKSNYSSRNSISPSEVRHHALPAFNSLARPVIRLQGLRPRRPPDSQNLSGTASNPIDRRQFVSTGAKFLSIMGWWCSGVKRLVAQGPGVEDEEAEEQDPVLTSSCGKICMEKCFSSFGQALVPGNRRTSAPRDLSLEDSPRSPQFSRHLIQSGPQILVLWVRSAFQTLKPSFPV
mmetsp:Transcript_18856/g.29484  ORF Transcript_18856/g.29484 Transcript_18856/m.29484 type:complete len:220 (-) Transcript_18856:559-1218(-)